MDYIKKILHKKRDKLLTMDENTPEFTLNDKYFLCKVVDVYDGDTCKVVFRYKGEYNKWNVRMCGYDSPEIRISKNANNREHLKKIGNDAKNHLIELFNKKELLYIKCGSFDKYGRLLGELYYSKTEAKNGKNSINEKMVNDGHGVSYNGGTKTTFV